MHGTPVFRGTRVPVQTLFDYLEGGESLEDCLEGFPSVSRALDWPFRFVTRIVTLPLRFQTRYTPAEKPDTVRLSSTILLASAISTFCWRPPPHASQSTM